MRPANTSTDLITSILENVSSQNSESKNSLDMDIQNPILTTLPK